MNLQQVSYIYHLNKFRLHHWVVQFDSTFLNDAQSTAKGTTDFMKSIYLLTNYNDYVPLHNEFTPWRNEFTPWHNEFIPRHTDWVQLFLHTWRLHHGVFQVHTAFFYIIQSITTRIPHFLRHNFVFSDPIKGFRTTRRRSCEPKSIKCWKEWYVLSPSQFIDELGAIGKFICFQGQIQIVVTWIITDLVTIRYLSPYKDSSFFVSA